MKGYKGLKFKLSRREGVNITGTTSERLQQVSHTAWRAKARPPPVWTSLALASLFRRSSRALVEL